MSFRMVARRSWYAYWSFALIALGVAVCWPTDALARKFDFKNESLATSLKGTIGPSQVGESPYGDSSGTATQFDKKVGINYSGEFGVIFSTEKINLRLGAELLVPESISDVKGSDAAGTELFNLYTKTRAYIPSVMVDLVFRRTPISKAFIGGGAGYAYVKLENQYTFTSDGFAAFGLGDFIEKAEAFALAGYFYAGYEILLADNATVVFDLGYRHLTANGFKATSAATTFLGDISAGSSIKKQDGTDRTIDLSSAYIGLAFRFYIPL